MGSSEKCRADPNRPDDRRSTDNDGCQGSTATANAAIGSVDLF